MTKFWNKETYGEEGNFYRKEDWGIELSELPGDNFTDKEPLGLDQQVIPKQHFDNDADEWVLDVPNIHSGSVEYLREENSKKINRWYSYSGNFANSTKISVTEIEAAVPEESRVGQFFVKDNSGKCHIVFCDPNGEYRFEKLTKAT